VLSGSIIRLRSSRTPQHLFSRAEAAEAIIAMDLPFGDWKQMKAEIIAGATEGGA